MYFVFCYTFFKSIFFKSIFFKSILLYKERTMKEITIFFFIILMFEYLYYYYYLSNWKKFLGKSVNIEKIEFNVNNKDELQKIMTNLLNERVKLLETMTYLQWLDYNNKNILLEFKGTKYYLYIYEKDNDLNSNDQNFILRASYQKELLNLNFSDELSVVNHRYIALEQFSTNPNLVEVMYNMNEIINGCNFMDYFWEDPFDKQAVQKTAYFKKYTKKSNNHLQTTGIIGIGYEVADLDYNYSDIYLNYVGLPFVIFVIFLIFILSLSMYYSINRPSYIRPGLILIGLNTFLMYQISLIGTITDIPLEHLRMNEINTSTIGITFLVATNIFIIKSIRTKHNKIYNEVYSESAFLFAASIMFLLFSMYKHSNYTEVSGLRRLRVQNQIFFNMSILMNFGIFLNFLLFITNKMNLFELKIFDK